MRWCPVPQDPTALAEALRDRYVLERELGRGGMATVYLARDLRHDRLVALKVLLPDLARSLGAERFLREIRTAARLQHPHILSVHDSGEAAGQLWFTMPYVEGETLRRRLERERQLPIDDALRIAREVADGLDCAHRHGVVHRDIKPENILLSEGHALVADFGISRALAPDGPGEALTETGVAVGTPAYMSPEQATGQAVDARTDVYALGVVLYEMLAGEPPFTGPTPQAVIAKRFHTDAVPLRAVRSAVPQHVDRAVARALARVPTDRFASSRRAGAGAGGGAGAGHGHGRHESPRRLTVPAAPGSCFSGSASSSASACSSRGPGRGEPSLQASAASSASRCCRSTTWRPRTRSTSPRASPTRSAASSPPCPASR